MGAEAEADLPAVLNAKKHGRSVLFYALTDFIIPRFREGVKNNS